MNTFTFSTIFAAITGAIGTAWETVRYPLAGMLTLVAGCLAGGCASMTKDQAESQRVIMQNWTDFAKQNGVSFVGQASYSGRGGLYQQSLWGIDTGLQAQGTFFFDPSKMPTETK